jgi:FtsP/CotA-like multicopper oxidase with cupredoxin domain
MTTCPLPIPPLVNLTGTTASTTVDIQLRQHRFARKAACSGTEPKKVPVFGSQAFVDGICVSDRTFGLPFFQVRRQGRPRIKWVNRTGYTSNIHIHGLSTSSEADGGAAIVQFGEGTSIGPTYDIHYPPVGNNSCTLWYHSHAMFAELPFVCSGFQGMIQVVDDISDCVSESFVYGNNHLILAYQDLDLNKDGSLTITNLPTDENRSCFGAINGISCVNWYSSEASPFVDHLLHTTTQHLLKIDILNSSANWRFLYLGICDTAREIRPFYHIQSDTGLINPTPLTMISIAVASRVGILVDLRDCKNGAYLFAYNFDLTEQFGASQAFPDQPTNPTLVALTPDPKIPNNTPNPTPIPDQNKVNPQDPSSLDFPPVLLIPQTKRILENGTIPPPPGTGADTKSPPQCRAFSMKILLFLKWKSSKSNKELSLQTTVAQIREIVFGKENYTRFRDLIDTPFFEYDPRVNYLTLLNRDYFFNLPRFDPHVPTRNVILFSEDASNSVGGGDRLGATEFINGCNRLVQDKWNSRELDLEYALQEYIKNPRFQPSVLPSTLFQITRRDLRYSNIMMMANDEMEVQLYEAKIRYGEKRKPLASSKLTFPPTPEGKPLNITQWVALVNKVLANEVCIEGKKTALSDFLTFNWNFYPFKESFVFAKTVFVKQVLFSLHNSSRFFVRLNAPWPLLQLLGKSICADTLMGSEVDQPAGCEDRNMSVQAFFPQFATDDPDVAIPLPSLCSVAELIVSPKTTFRGFPDGIMNDNLFCFSVSQDSSEQWIHSNLDTSDSHPLHQHLTTGYSPVHSSLTSRGLLTPHRAYAPFLYSKETFGVPPQQSLSYYLRFACYNSLQTAGTPGTPPIRGLGYKMHCHFLPHVEEMHCQYFVYPGKREEWF